LTNELVFRVRGITLIWGKGSPEVRKTKENADIFGAIFVRKIRARFNWRERDGLRLFVMPPDVLDGDAVDFEKKLPQKLFVGFAAGQVLDHDAQNGEARDHLVKRRWRGK
jgi:hypothetical protein